MNSWPRRDEDKLQSDLTKCLGAKAKQIKINLLNDDCISISMLKVLLYIGETEDSYHDFINKRSMLIIVALQFYLKYFIKFDMFAKSVK